MTFSLSQFITTVENDITTTEADVEQWIAQIQAGIAVLEADLFAGLKWVASVAPGWATTLQTLATLAESIPGLTIPAVVVSDIAAAIAALQSVETSVAAGTPTGQTLVSAYSAVVAATGAKAALQTAVTAVPTPAVTTPAA